MNGFPVIEMHAHTDRRFPGVEKRYLKIAPYYNIRKVCMLGDVARFGPDPSESQVRSINDETIRIVRKYPDFFIGFCFLSPNNGESFISREVDRCVIGNGFRGIKLLAAVRARSRKLDPVMQKARGLGIPVIHHCWYKTVGKKTAESNPADIANLASRFPDVPIVMAHLVGCRMRGVQDVKPHKNVHIDTSGSQPASGIVEYAVRELGASRLVHASDVPGRDFPSQLAKVLGAKIMRSQKERILCRNAMRILKLKDDEIW
jgi:hypothetical protein